MTAAITATGLKGFLKWLQQDQPAVYAATAAAIAKAAPKGFSGFNGSALRTAQMRTGRRSMHLRGLGCCLCSVGVCAATCGSSSINWGSTCTSCAANTGAYTCNSSLTGIANIITSVTGAALTAAQQSQYNALLQQQLSRAGSGLPPQTLSSSGVGVPQIGSLGTSGSLMLWLGGSAVVLYLLFGRK